MALRLGHHWHLLLDLIPKNLDHIPLNTSPSPPAATHFYRLPSESCKALWESSSSLGHSHTRASKKAWSWLTDIKSPLPRHSGSVFRRKQVSFSTFWRLPESYVLLSSKEDCLLLGQQLPVGERSYRHREILGLCNWLTEERLNELGWFMVHD